jgi:hypothetical protein
MVQPVGSEYQVTPCLTRGVRINLKLGDRKEKEAGKIYIIGSIIDWAQNKASSEWSDRKGMRIAASGTVEWSSHVVTEAV